ncbi:hypothetical protein RFH42_00815 [Acinetobacter rudis]|uniref:hypothetical protein n=1 Tax=Acinetobacter rudis TaxID=632955 RepID=UPI00280EC787|nr:hypothetical protein [Acinetobacter rudis]MDQ8951507.1 hypothetical protein [Acinetobacter rudis]
MLVKLGRLLGLIAILLQIIVFLQPLLPEKYSVFRVCNTVVNALYLKGAHTTQQSPLTKLGLYEDHANGMRQTHTHHFINLQNHHQQNKDSQIDDYCQFCLVHSFTLPLVDTKHRTVLIRIRTLLLLSKTTIFYKPALNALEFLIPESRAPPPPA